MTYTTYASQPFDEEDVLQEMALFQLETGKLPRKTFIRHRLTRILGGISISYDDPEALDSLAIPFIVSDDDEQGTLSEDEITSLIRWSSEQSTEVQVQVDIVLGYEEGDPTEALVLLLRLLGKPNRTKKAAKGKADTTTKVAANTRRLILELLTEKGPTPRDLIVEALHPVISSVYQCRRPAAAIRQALRSMTRSGQVDFEPGRLIYSVPQEK